ncbi:hypothetical protein F4V58_09475 [Corynebacterium phocae]|nr:hypothetical protein F4V58_09475 [Corynebacterium phocae]
MRNAYLIFYHRRSGRVNLQRFDSFVEATKHRLTLDRTNGDPDVEIVVIASKSEEDLRQSHSRYFARERVSR